MRYSLADYIITITFPADFAAALQLSQDTLSIGGEGSYLDSINVSTNENIWETEGDSTGSWVHNKNLSRTGKVSISINQLSDKIAKFKRICNLYYNADTDFDGLTISLTDTRGNNVALCNDCYFVKIPDQNLQATAQNQTWDLTCGQVTFN